MTKVRGEQLGRVQSTCASASLTSYLSISYLLAELSELLIHRFGSPKCVVAEISVCSDFFSIKRIAKRKIRVEKIELELIMRDIAIGYLARCSDLFCQFEKCHGYCLQGWYFLVIKV